MHYICYDCGEIFDTPLYKKDRYGRHVVACPACGCMDDVEEEYDDEDDQYEDIIEYEEFED